MHKRPKLSKFIQRRYLGGANSPPKVASATKQIIHSPTCRMSTWRPRALFYKQRGIEVGGRADLLIVPMLKEDELIGYN